MCIFFPYVCLCTTVCLVPLRSEEDTGSPGTKITVGCELPCGFGNWTLSHPSTDLPLKIGSFSSLQLSSLLVQPWECWILSWSSLGGLLFPALHQLPFSPLGIAQPLKRLLGWRKDSQESTGFGLVWLSGSVSLYYLLFLWPYTEALMSSTAALSLQTPCLCPLPDGLRSIWSSLRRSCGWESRKEHLPPIDGK